jgi:hypothetical protein
MSTKRRKDLETKVLQTSAASPTQQLHNIGRHSSAISSVGGRNTTFSQFPIQRTFLLNDCLVAITIPIPFDDGGFASEQQPSPPRIVAGVRQRVAACMPQHVWMDLKAYLVASPPARASSLAKPDGVNGPPRFDANTNGEAVAIQLP